MNYFIPCFLGLLLFSGFLSAQINKKKEVVKPDSSKKIEVPKTIKEQALENIKIAVDSSQAPAPIDRMPIYRPDPSIKYNMPCYTAPSDIHYNMPALSIPQSQSVLIAPAVKGKIIPDTQKKKSDKAEKK